MCQLPVRNECCHAADVKVVLVMAEEMDWKTHTGGKNGWSSRAESGCHVCFRKEAA